MKHNQKQWLMSWWNRGSNTVFTVSSNKDKIRIVGIM